MWAFAKSVLFGTVAAAALPSALTIALAIDLLSTGLDGGERLFPALWLAAFPAVVTFPLVLGASLVFGLPLTIFLKRYERETAAAYVISGSIIGGAIPLIILAPDGNWGALLGAFSGAVTGLTWWRSARAPKGGLPSKLGRS